MYASVQNSTTYPQTISYDDSLTAVHQVSKISCLVNWDGIQYWDLKITLLILRNLLAVGTCGCQHI